MNVDDRYPNYPQSIQSEFPKFRMFLFHAIPKEAAASIRAPARSSQELTSPSVG